MRLVFADMNNLKKWVDDYVSADRYVACVTQFNEIVFVPLKSTRPLVFGYYSFREDEKKQIDELLSKLGVKVYNVKAVDWDETKFPSVRMVEQKIEVVILLYSSLTNFLDAVEKDLVNLNILLITTNSEDEVVYYYEIPDCEFLNKEEIRYFINFYIELKKLGFNIKKFLIKKIRKIELEVVMKYEGKK